MYVILKTLNRYWEDVRKSEAQTVPECSLDGPLQTLRFLFRYEIQNGGYGRTCLTLDPLGKMFQNASSLKPNCPGMIIGRFSVFYADCFFLPIGNPRWLPPQVIVLTQDHMVSKWKFIQRFKESQLTFDIHLAFSFHILIFCSTNSKKTRLRWSLFFPFREIGDNSTLYQRCGSYHDFLDKGLLLTRNLLYHELIVVTLKSLPWLR